MKWYGYIQRSLVRSTGEIEKFKIFEDKAAFYRALALWNRDDAGSNQYYEISRLSYIHGLRASEDDMRKYDATTVIVLI